VELKLPEINETENSSTSPQNLSGHKNELEKKPQLTYEQLRKKQHKQFEPTLLQLNSVFPHLSFDELLTAVLLTEKNGKANLDEAIDLIIEGGHKKSLPIAKPGEISVNEEKVDVNEKKLDIPPPIKKAVEKTIEYSWEVKQILGVLPNVDISNIQRILKQYKNDVNQAIIILMDQANDITMPKVKEPTMEPVQVNPSPQPKNHKEKEPKTNKESPVKQALIEDDGESEEVRQILEIMPDKPIEKIRAALKKFKNDIPQAIIWLEELR